MNQITLLFLVILITNSYSYSYYSNNKFINKSLINLGTSSEFTNTGIYPTTIVYHDDITLAKAVCNDLLTIVTSSIKEKGKAFVAVPGGSVLKMLSGLKSNKNDIDWTKVYWFYVNHKCVSSNDETSTHNKACKYFMKELYPTEIDLTKNVISIDIDDNVVGHDTISHKYEKRIKDLLPTLNKLPIFDFMLLGMGADGHIGSLYPNRKEVTISNSWVLTVDKKKPPSITLSLPVMNAARYNKIIIIIIIIYYY
jgi:6-phosphogluconolactonase